LDAGDVVDGNDVGHGGTIMTLNSFPTVEISGGNLSAGVDTT
jgi:hypothetical protein